MSSNGERRDKPAEGEVKRAMCAPLRPSRRRAPDHHRLRAKVLYGRGLAALKVVERVESNVAGGRVEG